eukprot:4453662-Amphidinium_carterae.1
MASKEKGQRSRSRRGPQRPRRVGHQRSRAVPWGSAPSGAARFGEQFCAIGIARNSDTAAATPAATATAQQEAATTTPVTTATAQEQLGATSSWQARLVSLLGSASVVACVNGYFAHDTHDASESEIGGQQSECTTALGANLKD